jgi:hypothetical protein
MISCVRRTLALSSGLVLLASVALADGGANHQVRQTRPISLGTSGGNVNDRSNAFCCSGTLGSLVTNGANQYVLSNNHVLARVNQGVAGEAVNQPGNIDASPVCADLPADYVANLSSFVPIDFTRGSTNVVDCAIAQVQAGDVNTNGDIIDIGQVSGSVLTNPAIGTSVKKSGRTTGLTTGSVTAVNATVSVQYQMGCGKGKKATATYVNQVVFSNMSGGGDSGSLIVTNIGSCPRPVALLYAGSSSSTVGCPMASVLSALGVTMVTGSCPSANAFEQAVPDAASDFAFQHAVDVQNRATPALLDVPGIVGTGISTDASGQRVIQVYLETDNPGLRGQVPDRLEDVATQIVVTGVIEAY